MKSLDFRLIAHNLRCMRMGRNLTQAELANQASVDKATVQRLESGKRVHVRSLQKICDVFHEPIAFVNSVLPFGQPELERQLFVHRRADLSWFTLGEHRKKVPQDSQARIQDEKERRRLGRGGLVASFQAYAFSMPNGPGISLSEIYGPVVWGPSSSYRDCVTYCLHGELLVTVAGEKIRLAEGDGLGHNAREVSVVEPANPIGPDERAPIAMYVGVNRVGYVPIEFNGQKRVRTRRPRAL